MNKKYLLIIVFIVGLLFFWINKKFGLLNHEVSRNKINSVNALEFKKLTENKDSFLLDVHIPEQVHIPGTDAFIPYNEISQNLDKLPQDKDTPILIYCRSGSMSKQAALELMDLGYTNVVGLAGGVNEYKEANVSVDIDPKSKDLGTVIYGDVTKTEYILTNYTPQKLSITRVSTSCSCTSADVEKKSLDPYESTTVFVSFDPSVHKDDTDLGELTRTIYIDTDNPNFKQVTAMFYANVIKK